MLARRSVRLWMLAFAASLFNRVASAELAATYGNLPLTFEENRGQAAPVVRFIAHAGGSSISLSETAIEVKAFRIEFVRANRAASLEGVGRFRARPTTSAVAMRSDGLAEFRTLAACGIAGSIQGLTWFVTAVRVRPSNTIFELPPGPISVESGCISTARKL